MVDNKSKGLNQEDYALRKLSTAILILAAGSSSRLGQPKQLLDHQKDSFIQYFSKEALKVSDQVLVILGSYQEEIRKSIAHLPVKILFNAEWNEGMASSIRTGIKFLMEIPKPVDLAIIMVCDQPFVNADLLGKILYAYIQTGKRIIASEYQNTLGTPVLFHRSFFPELIQLRGTGGAKKTVSENPDSVGCVPFPEGTFDIDTPGDLEAFQKDLLPKL